MTPFYRRAILTGLFSLGFLNTPLWSEPPTALPPLTFADALMLQKRPHDAEVEYERFATFNPGSPLFPSAIERMLNAALATEDFAFALNLARTWEPKTSGDAQCQTFFYEDVALYRLGNYSGLLSSREPTACREDTQGRTFYARGLAELRLRQWSEASTEFRHVPVSSSLYASADDAATQAPLGASIALKSPAIAAGLSAILPGAGYAYADRPQTAAAAFLINGVFIGGTYSAVHAGQWGVGALLALFSLGWYSGAIYGSAQAATRDNASREDRFIRPFEIRW